MNRKSPSHVSLAIWANQVAVKCLSIGRSCTQWPQNVISTLIVLFLFRARYWLRPRPKRALQPPECSTLSLSSSRDVHQDSFSLPVRAPQSEGNVDSGPHYFGQADDLFELGQRLKKGGHGIVYECTRLSTATKYAAKVVNTSPLVRSQRELAILRREICIMRELHHPKIVNIFTAYFEDTDCKIVMDIAEGGDLFDLIDAEVNLMRSSGRIFRGIGGCELVSKHVAHQLLEGIGYMHWNNVIHRDLKLDNILIMTSYPAPDVKGCQFHDVKIADFGLSTKMSSFACRTPAGTPAYVAPEVLDEVYDHRVDFWSFGVILYAMFCGQMPFHVSSMRPEQHKQEVSSIRVCDSWDLVSSEAQDMVRGLLTADPDERLSLDGCVRHLWFVEDMIQPLSPTFRRNSPGRHSSGRHSPDKVPDLLQMETSTRGVVKEITGWTGANLMSAQILLVDGSVSSFGDYPHETSSSFGGFSRQCSPARQISPTAPPVGPSPQAARKGGMGGILMGGAVHNAYELGPEECIIAVMQDRFFGSPLGNALVFYTSASRIIALQGTDARRRNRFVAPVGWQIIGLQFEGNVLTGTHVERVSSEKKGSVMQISGRAASAVDEVSLHLTDGSVHSYGGEGGTGKGPWSLEPSELVLVVEQGHKERCLGASMVFYTSFGNIFKLCGVTAFPSRRFAVASDEQVCDLEFDCSLLSRVCTCPRNGDLKKSRWHTLS